MAIGKCENRPRWGKLRRPANLKYRNPGNGVWLVVVRIARRAGRAREYRGLGRSQIKLPHSQTTTHHLSHASNQPDQTFFESCFLFSREWTKEREFFRVVNFGAAASRCRTRRSLASFEKVFWQRIARMCTNLKKSTNINPTAFSVLRPLLPTHSHFGLLLR